MEKQISHNLGTRPAVSEARPASAWRPPVVVVMGHVDHGKTTLVDFIRQTKVAEKETGGITQHIGAYEITHAGKKITFIDTPGHEAFSQIRSRGAHAADIAILVVGADDGVQPQTKEALEHIKTAGIPYVVALNKIDRPSAQVDRVKKQLAEAGVLLEGWGGDVPVAEISAKIGTGVNELLDLLLLIAEMNPLTTDPEAKGNGVILESKRDSARGLSLTALILDGTIKAQDYIVIGKEYGKIKILLDFLGHSITTAHASSPVVIYGFTGKAGVGETWQIAHSEKEAQSITELHKEAPQAIPTENGNTGKKILKIILKSDVYGSKEAIESLVSKFNFKEVGVEFLKSEVGDIGEEDLKLSRTTGAKLFGFKTKFLPQAEANSKMMDVEVIFTDIIYELIDKIKEEAAKLLTPEIEREDLGEVKILAVFGKAKDGQIIGGKVTKGRLEKQARAEVMRGDKLAGTGTIKGLQSNKTAVNEVEEGHECGIFLSGNIKVEVGDILKAYCEKKITHALE